MKLREFFIRNPVFTSTQITSFLGKQGSGNRWTRKALLAYFVKKGRLIRVRRGLYATVPEGSKAEDFHANPFLVASRITDDAVLSHHTALEFYGKTYSVFHLFTYLSSKPSQEFSFQMMKFKGILFPSKLQGSDNEMFGVENSARYAMNIKATGFERTMVDLLDKPRWGGSWEEIWRSLEMVEFFNLDKVIEYALLLENSSTIAKVGFFLEQHREALMVEDKHLEPLRKHKPKSPHYFDRKSRKPNRFIKEWNLVVPVEIIERSWEEVL
jgi:predicted transcriptional regulator of viral defense system